LDEMFVAMNGARHALGRAVDQDGHIPDILVQRRRDKQAATLESLPGVEHRRHRYLDNRAENSHQPTRQRDQRMQRFKSPRHAQPFLAAYGPTAQHFRPRRHRFSAPEYRHEMRKRGQLWGESTGMVMAA
jgi:putative transposase